MLLGQPSLASDSNLTIATGASTQAGHISLSLEGISILFTYCINLSDPFLNLLILSVTTRFCASKFPQFISHCEKSRYLEMDG